MDSWLELDPIERNHAAELPHVRVRVKLGLDEGVERIDILHENDQNEVGFAGDHPALADFGCSPHRSPELVEEVEPFPLEFDIDDDSQRLPDHLRVEQRDIADDDPARAQASDAAHAGGCRGSDAVRDLSEAKPAILLQRAEDSTIEVV